MIVALTGCTYRGLAERVKVTQFIGLPSLLNRVAVAFGCLLVLLTTASLSVSADLPLTRLWTIFPPGGRAVAPSKLP